jgi:HAD superfamily hydrolase (TIGR01509 family)
MQKRPWILFDIGGVLEIVDDDNWPTQFATRWQRRTGLTPDEYRARLDSLVLPAVDREAGTEQSYWRLVGGALGLDALETRRMRADLWDAYCGELNVELMEFARSLAARAGVAILSNSIDGAREEEERRYRFSRVFDPICYSHESGVGKPDAAAYEHALTLMDAAPQDVLFIDDHESAVAGAREVGIRGILHRENATTIAEIERFLTEREYAAS